MTRPLASPKAVAQFDRYHAEIDQTLDNLEAACANLVAANGECRGLAAMTAYLIATYGEVPALAALLSIALHRRTQQHQPGG